MGPELESEIRVRLAHVRYEVARAANSAGDRLTSVRKMALVAKEPGWDESLKGPLALYALWCEDLAEHESADWYTEVLWAYQKLGETESGRDEQLGYRAGAALALQGLDRHEEAAAELRAVLAAQPGDKELLARCWEALKRSEDALAGRTPKTASPVAAESVEISPTPVEQTVGGGPR
jgi:hypothetical protein